MKSKLFVLLVSLSVGSNSVAMEDWISPSAWKAWYQAKRTTKPTQFILSCLSKSSNLKLEGLDWKDELLKVQQGTLKANESALLEISALYNNGAKMRFYFKEGGSNSDPRIDDQYEDHITITTIFDQTNPAINKEQGFDYAFKKGWNERFNRNRVYTKVDKWTSCGFKEMFGFVCKTKVPFQQFIDEIKKAEHKEQK